MTTTFQEEQKNIQSFFDESCQSLLKEDPLSRSRKRAWEQFQLLGIPDRKAELFRYIKLHLLFSKSYQKSLAKTIVKELFSSYILPECTDSYLLFINGHFQPALSSFSQLPSSLVISTLKEAARPYGAFLNNQWTQFLKEEKDPFAALNSALYEDGAFLYLPPKTVLQTPIQILHLVDTEQIMWMSPRLQIFMGAFSEASIISHSVHLTSEAGCYNGVTDIAIEEGAHLTYTQVGSKISPKMWQFDALRASLKRNSTIKTICVTQGSETVRYDYKVLLTQENGEALLNGLWMLEKKNEAHVHVLIDHQAPYCSSSQLFKGVLNDASRSSFEGKILVQREAKKTDAFQLNNNLILSNEAHADSKPNLEIFEGDVKASHGATVGQLDPEQLFYMKTRGFSEKEAKKLLVQGFCEEVLQMIPSHSHLLNLPFFNIEAT